jgi:outer membrane protein
MGGRNNPSTGAVLMAQLAGSLTMKQTCRRIAGLAAGALTLAAGSVAQAQAADDSSSDLTLFGWNLSGRVSVQVAPDYLGSKRYSVGPTASFSFHRAGSQHRFHAPDDSPSLQLLGDAAFSGGVIVRGRSSRKAKDDLRGVHKVDFALEPGVYLEAWPAEGFRLHGELRRGVTGNQAWSGDVAADLVSDDGKWVVSAGPRVHLGDSRFTRTYFDVTPADAAGSPFGLTPFAASGTFVSWGALASAEYRWSPRLSVLADMRYDRLTGDAADSPIVAKIGSANQVRGSIGVRYRFGG